MCNDENTTSENTVEVNQVEDQKTDISNNGIDLSRMDPEFGRMNMELCRRINLPSTQIGSITERILTGKGSQRTFNFTCFSYALRTTETVVTLTRLPFGRFCFYHVICVDMRILLTGALKKQKQKK